MTDELTLREKVLGVVRTYDDDPRTEYDVLDAICAALLEDTGSPAHMRVAAELRGE